MPTYVYECESCGHSFELLQGMAEKKLRKCTECKKLKLVRLIGSGSGIIFKGSGFYETDYKKKDAPKVPEAKTEKPAKPSKASPKKEKAKKDN